MDAQAEMMRQRIASRLSDLKLTPITAATKAELPRDTIRNLFRQEGSSPRLDTIIKIAAALETTVAYLVGETDYPRADYSDENVLELSRAAIETAKPIPVIGYATWGYFEKIRHTHAGELIDLLFLNVPGFLDTPLQSVLVTDDHADMYYPAGRYIIFAIRDIAGLRNGDHVVCLRKRGDEGEFTVRELVTEKHRKLSEGTFLTGGGLATLAVDDKSYPSITFREADRASAEGSRLIVVGVVVADLGFVERPAEPGMFPGIEAGTRTVADQVDG